MKITGDFIIRCSSCGAEFKIDTDFLDEDVLYIGEGGMGEQYEHIFPGELECDQCGERISFRLLGYEYPVGARRVGEMSMKRWSLERKRSMGIPISSILSSGSLFQ